MEENGQPTASNRHWQRSEIGIAACLENRCPEIRVVGSYPTAAAMSEEKITIPGARRIYPQLIDNSGPPESIINIWEHMSPRLKEMMLRFQALQMLEEQERRKCGCPSCRRYLGEQEEKA